MAQVLETGRGIALAALLASIAGLAVPAPAAAQAPRAILAVVADADGVTPGGTLRLAVRVTLPEGVHVQSNRPRDPFLIATTVTPTLLSGLTLLETVFPEPTDFTQAGAPEPLSVFEHDVSIGLKVRVDDAVAPGAYALPLRLRYQACNERNCFPPTRETLTTTLHVVPPGTTPALQHQDVFAALRFRR